MKLGLIVNPYAGGGIDEEKRAMINDVLNRLKPEIVYAAEGLGADLLADFNVKKINLTLTHTREDTLKLVKILDDRVDLIAVFGGDGTMSDVASAKPKTPLLCIGIGTTNVSPVLCDPDFEVDELKLMKVRALELCIGDDVRLAFNDVVVGSTILATVDGKRVQVDAREYMKGRKIIAKPRKFYALIEVGEKTIEGEFGNVFISMPDRRFLGKGIAGGTSLSAFLGFKGVVACISDGIVVSTYTKDDVRKLEPIVTQTISFDDEAVRIRANEVISCDGNPVGLGKAEVRIIDEAVKVMKVG